MKSYQNLVVLLLAVPHVAVCQQNTGTIVVFRVMHDHVIVAADSKATSSGVEQKSEAVYNVCKILTFDNQYIFAYTGYSARRPFGKSASTSWNVRDITRRLYQQGSISSTDDFARKWAAKMKAVLVYDSKISPPSSHNGLVLFGLFVGVSNGNISTVAIQFELGQDGQIRTKHRQIGSGLDAAGEADIFIEFQANKTRRANLWHSRIDKLGPDDQVIALAKLVRQFDTSGHVGGPIDSVRITPYGMQWLSVKPKCGPSPQAKNAK
jgi:hypothetical protein